MSLDWGTIRTAIKAAIVSISDIDESQIVWFNASQPFNPNVLIRLQTFAARGLGVDEERHTESDEGGIVTTVCGNRLFTLRITVESLSQENDEIALNYTEKIRTRFGRTSTRETLRLSNLVINNNLATVSIPMVDGDRHWSKDVFDFLMSTTVNEQDDMVDDNHYIDRVVIESLIDGAIITTSLRAFDDAFATAEFRKTSIV